MQRFLLTVTVALVSQVAEAQDWSRFRGPNGSGVAPESNPPVRFGPEENRRWRTDVPFGASSPILTEKAVIVTGSDEDSLLVVALARETGEKLWTKAIERKTRLETYKDNDSASPSPVSDGTNVYAFFPELGLIALDDKGEELWRHPLGPFVNFYGMSSSPVLAAGVVVLLCDQQQGSFIVGVDAKTGKQRWRTDRSGLIECWATPVVYPAADPTQVLVFGSYYVTSHSLATGEELWRLPGFGYTPVCSPVLAGDRLFVSVPNHATAGIPDWKTVAGTVDGDKDNRLDKSEVQGEMAEHFGWIDVNKDDIIEEEEWNAAYEGMNSKNFGLSAIDLAGEDGPVEVWRTKKGLPSIASPLLYEGVLYLVRDGGLVTLVDAKKGEVLGRERLPDAIGESWPSPVGGGGKVYILNNAGQVAVVAAGPKWNVLQTNDLGEDCRATPAVGGDALYVRSRSAVWCLGSEPQ